MTIDTTRRALIAGIPAVAVAAAVPAVAVAAQVPAPSAPTDLYTAEEYEAARKSAEDIAYLHMARAWVDRWKALGGDFGLRFNRDGAPEGVHRGMVVALELWSPTDEGRDDIPPHTHG